MKGLLIRGILSFAGLLCISTIHAEELVGSLEGEIQINQGVASWDLPIETPAGPNGTAPSLTLSYNQASPNGIVGVGFSLSGLSSISRCPQNKIYDGKKGGVQFNENDRYCLDGQRLIAISGNDGDAETEYRTARESYSRIISKGQQGSGPLQWEVRTKDGYIHEYGGTTDSRISRGNSDAILTWNISSKKDRFDNSVDYHYINDRGTTIPERISFSKYEVVFDYEPRQDVLDAWQQGEQAFLDKRINKIRVTSNDALLREYRLEYGTVGVGNYSRLDSAQLCDVNGDCAPATTFGWEQEVTTKNETVSLISGTDKFKSYKMVDLNQDGFKDVCYANEGLYCALYDHTTKRLKPFTLWAERKGYRQPGFMGGWSYGFLFDTYRFLDLNNDGYPDVCSELGAGIFCALNNQENGFNEGDFWSRVNFDQERIRTVAGFNSEDIIRFIDINNDSYPDICSLNAHKPSVWESDGETYGYVRDSVARVKCAINNKNNVFDSEFILANTGFISSNQSVAYGSENSTAGFIDINGDGFVDLCGSGAMPIERNTIGALRPLDFGCMINQRLSDDNIPQLDSIKSLATLGNIFFGVEDQVDDSGLAIYYKFVNSIVPNSFRYTDLNADGLTDICFRSYYHRKGWELKCAINTGKGFNPAKEWSPVHSNDWGELVEDINNDGRADLCLVIDNKFQCALNTGTRFGSFKHYASLDFRTDIFYIQGEKSKPGPTPISLHDINGDGGLDVCYRSRDGLDCELGAIYENSLLKTITTGYGNKTTLKYGQISDPALYTAATTEPTNPLLRNVKGYRRVVESVETSNGIGGFNKQSYTYEDMKNHIERGVRSFRKITKTNHATHKTTETTYYQDDDRNGLVEKAVEKIKVGNSYKTIREASVSYDVSHHSDNANITIIHQNTSTESRYELDGSLISTKNTVYKDRTKEGDPQTVTVSTNDINNNSVQIITTTKYKTFDSSQWLLGKPETVSVIHTSSEGADVTRRTQFEYNEDGSLKKEILQPGSDQELTSTFTYDAFGNRNSTTTRIKQPSDKGGITFTKPSDRTSRVTFDTTYGLYIESRTNAKGHKEYLTDYDDRCSSPGTLIDVNNLKTTITYDSLCRKEKTQRPDGTTTVITHQLADEFDIKGKGKAHAIYQITETSSGQAPKTAIYDSLGREIRTITKAFDGRDVYQDKIYDARGQVIEASLPYYANTDVDANAESIQWVVSTYDELGRTKTQKRPDGPLTRYVYRGLTTQVTDPKGRTKTTVKNLLDKTASITQPGNDNGTEKDSIVRFSYDAIGNLLQSNSNGSIISMSYDAVGNKISMTDPVMGYWEYAYNGFGELIWQKDAKGQTTLPEYDVLGRMVKRTLNDKNGMIAVVDHWSYDSAINGIGKLAGSQSGSSSKSLTYDTKGRPNSTTTTIDDRSFTVEVGYDQYSRPIKETYPGGIEVRKDYTDQGHLKTVRMPNEQIREYDYASLQLSFTELEQQIEALATKVKVSRDHYLQASAKADEYEETSAYWRQNSTYYEKNAQALDNYAKRLRSTAARYKQISDAYQATAQTYLKRYGEQMLTFVRKDATHAYYQQTKCTSYWKTGGCRTSTSSVVKIPTGDLKTCEYAWCDISIPAQLNLGDHYLQKANYYKSREVQFKGNASYYEGSADRYHNTASSYAQKANHYKQLATESIATAERELAEFKKYQQEITQLLDKKDGIQRRLDEHNNQSGYTTLWSAEERDASGRLTTAYLGNDMLTRKYYDRASGQLKQITTSFGSDDTLIRDLQYDYDALYNVTQREDKIQGITDNYGYDELDRVDYVGRTTTSGSGGYSQDFTYDLLGNLNKNLDVTSMHYAGNRLTDMSRKNGTTASYQYDANGNMIKTIDSASNKSRTIDWTTFNKPQRIKQGDNHTRFEYDAEHNRTKQVLGANGRDETTYYVGKAYEYIVRNDGLSHTIKQHKYYIYAGGEVIAIQQRTEEQATGDAVNPLPDETRFLHTDSLGSVDTITDDRGGIVQRVNFDPFGKRHIVSGIRVRLD